MVPSIQQQAYQHVELTAYIHFGMETFDGTEQGNPGVDAPSLFNPASPPDPNPTSSYQGLTQDTVDHWVDTLQGAGFGQAQLVTKHAAGFCLWPSASTKFTVAYSPWPTGAAGTGDVVKMFVAATNAKTPSKRTGPPIRTASYLSPYDQNFPSTNSSYQTGFTTQLTELLTNSNYGNVYEVTFDGFNSPGSTGRPATINWGGVFAQARTLQKNILIWAGPEISQQAVVSNPPEFNDLQWIGTESGTAVTDCSGGATSSLDDCYCAKNVSGTYVVPDGSKWCSQESNTTDTGGDWFWHKGHTPVSLADLENIYFTTVGRNATLIFNVPPDQTGDFDPADVTLLNGFGSWHSSTFKTNLLKGAPATADSTWATAGFDASKAVDDELCTYWSAASGTTTGTLTVTPASPINIKVLSIREPIEMGERVTKWSVETQNGGSWTSVPLGPDQGTVIGNRQLVQVNLTSVSGIRLVIGSARDVPLISEFAAY